MVQWVPTIVTGVGVVLLILITILGWVVIPNIIDDQILEEVKLVNGSDTWNKWVEIPVPVYLKFYIFNITNPDAVNAGTEKPNFEEIGPYSYKELRKKVNVSLHDNDEVVKYEQTITYWFSPETSCETCKETDEVSIVNVAFMSVIHVLGTELSPALASIIANSALGSEKFIRTGVQVGDLTFQGFDVEIYTSTLGPLLPEEFSGGRFGLYKGNNESADGIYHIFTGTGNSADFGRVKLWENSSYLPADWFVENSTCAMINGTDGSLFPPFAEKDWVMYVYSTDLCRSLYLNFEQEVEYKDIKGYRYVATKRMLEDPRTNRENLCFCKDGETNIDSCPKGGVMHIGGCKGGAPIMMSTPYFLDGPEEYRSTYTGLSEPNKEKHETVIDIEPNSGLTLRANKRIQVNVEIIRWPEVNALKNAPEYMIFPLLWADEEARLDEENAQDVKDRLLTPVKIIGIVKWVVLGVSIATIIVGVAIFIIRRRRARETV